MAELTFHFKPAPFYLFDELDQALDSTYRAAVASMIQRQANSDAATQFIVSPFLIQLAKGQGDRRRELEWIS